MGQEDSDAASDSGSDGVDEEWTADHLKLLYLISRYLLRGMYTPSKPINLPLLLDMFLTSMFLGAGTPRRRVRRRVSRSPGFGRIS